MTFPRDPNAPRFNAKLNSNPPKYHIKGDPLGRTSFPKPFPRHGYGANKYAPNNWRRGMRWGESDARVAAALKHQYEGKVTEMEAKQDEIFEQMRQNQHAEAVREEREAIDGVLCNDCSQRVAAAIRARADTGEKE